MGAMCFVKVTGSCELLWPAAVEGQATIAVMAAARTHRTPH
jgi:hypothetical protein